VQDDIKLSRNLTINLGLRYEYSSWYSSRNSPPNSSWFDTLGNNGLGQFVWSGPNPITGEPANTSATFIEPDRNNWAPRVGIAYLLGSKTTIRTGYSIFYGSNIAWEGNHMRGNYPYAVGQDLPVNRTLPTNPTSNPFPPIDFNTVAPSAQHTARRDNRMPYVQQWNFGIQQQLMDDLMLEVNYIGSKGTRLSAFISGNDARPGPGDIQPRRPFPQHLGGFSENRSDAVSSYHGLTTKLEKRFARGLSYTLNYSWSKSMDLNSQWGGTSPQNAYNARNDIGLSDFDRRHIFSSDIVWMVPNFSGLTGVAGRVLNGWEMNGIILLQTGRPFNVTIPFDNANVGSRGSFQRPNVNGQIQYLYRREQWFDTSVFTLPAPFTFGNAGRNVLTSPGLANVDYALFKNFPFKERHNVQFRAELFNIFNRTNFNIPGGSFGTPGFARITSTQPARQIQFALKYLF
jgi:hypothetical protein